MGLAVIREPRLREANLGKWQGRLSGEIEAQYPQEFRRWHDSPVSVQPPGGESIPALAARVLEAINEIATRHSGQRVGVVSHELPIAVVRCRSAGLGLEHLRRLIPETGTWQEIVLE
jgi:broad specificity phosphatase PhoE